VRVHKVALYLRIDPTIDHEAGRRFRFGSRAAEDVMPESGRAMQRFWERADLGFLPKSGRRALSQLSLAAARFASLG
jgi:hypothetical protein